MFSNLVSELFITISLTSVFIRYLVVTTLEYRVSFIWTYYNAVLFMFMLFDTFLVSCISTQISLFKMVKGSATIVSISHFLSSSIFYSFWNFNNSEMFCYVLSIKHTMFFIKTYLILLYI